MAAPKENLLSLGHLTGIERNTFTKQREHSLKNSVHRPLLLQTDFSTLQSHQHLRVMHLQQRWQELKERELTAQQHNRQLLQQFEKAQDTLREMLAHNAAMKMIRMEYERYLEESAPRWQQQLKEKTQAAQRKRMEEYLRSCLKNTEQEQMTDRPLLSQGLAKKTQKVSASQENNNNQSSHSDYNQDVSSHLPYVQSSWLTHTQSQTARFPIRVPCQPQGSSHAPPSYLPRPAIFPHPHQFQLQHLASLSSHHHHHHHHPWPRQDPPGWASPQPDYPWSWPTGAAGIPSGSGALLGQLYTEQPPNERGVEAETSRAPSSKRERGGGSRSSHLSQELDIKPVRLSSGHAESSESGRDSSQARREMRKRREKRGKTRSTSSHRDRCSSQESSMTSSAIVVAGVTVVQSSESETSSEKRSTSGSGRTRTRSGGLAVGSPTMEEVANESTRSKGDDSGSHKEESNSTSEESVSQIEKSRSENVLNQGPDDKSDSCREEVSQSVSIKIENGAAEIEKQERRSSAEESSAEEKDEEEEEHEDLEERADGEGEEKENSQINEEQESRNVEEDDGEVSAKKNTAEEEEETEAEEELEDQGDDEDSLKNEDGENRTQGSASSQDEEDESEQDDNKIGEDEEGSAEEEGEGEEEEEEEERGSDEVGEAEEERDSEDSIISPQNRLKKMHIIPEEAAEDDDDEQKGSKTGSSDEVSIEFSEDDDIEDLLAPQEQGKKEEKDLKVDDKPEATCDKVEIFQVELDNSTKTDHQSDSDEFDHFYD